MIARRFLVQGRVQGVGFRYFAHRAAHEFGISGWARNLPDGQLEIYAQGEPDQMERFLDRIRSGPPPAVVQDLKIEEVSPQPEAGFTIER